MDQAIMNIKNKFKSVAAIPSAALIAAFAVFMFYATPAPAEGNCPYGHVPTYDSGGSGRQIGCYPLPASEVSSGPASPQSPRTPGWVTGNYYAIVRHKQANDVWIASGYRDRGPASNAAFGACTAMMGGGCEVFYAGYNTTLVLVKSGKGEPFIGGKPSRKQSEAEALGHCRANSKGDCSIVRVVEIKPFRRAGKDIDPKLSGPVPGDNVLISYGALAWGSVESQHVWFSGGHATEDAAKSAASGACEKDLAPQRCTIAETSISTHIGVMTGNSKGQVYYYTGVGQTSDLARADLTRLCEAKGLEDCFVGTTFDARTPGTTRIDPQKVGRPYNTAQAWTKGNATLWSKSVWSVSGSLSEDEAKQAALTACRNDSEQDCDILTSSFDSRVALYVDQTGSIRFTYVNRKTDPTPFAQKNCVEEKLTCKVFKVVDSHVPETARFEVQ